MSFLDLRPSPPQLPETDASPSVRWSTYSRQPLYMSWPIALCLLLILVLPGLLGREPWRGDDAEQFGVIAELLQGGSWLIPGFQGDTWNTSPLYYWVNALIAWPASLIFALPDAARLGNLFWLAVTVYAIHQTARSALPGEDSRPLPLLLLSAPGLLLSIHETQPDLAIMAGYSIYFWGCSRISFERVMPGSTLTALGIGVAILAGGVWVALPLIVTLLILMLTQPKLRLNSVVALMLGLLLGFSWFIHAAAFGDPDPEALFEAIWPVATFHPLAELPQQALSFCKLVAWTTWPAWPIALWTLWRRKHSLSRPDLLLPLTVLVLAFAVQAVFSAVRPSKSLILLIPILLLAVPSVTHLRRGAANMLDAFTMTLFTFTAGFIWLGWSAIHFGWPEHLSQTVTRLEPGFRTPLTLLAPAVSFLLTIGWFVLMRNIPRSPVRGIQHWFAGITLIWALVVALWSPWLEHGMSFTRVGDQIAKHLDAPGCIATYKVSDDARAALSYQLDRPLPRSAIRAGQDCPWLLTEVPGNAAEAKRPKGWESADKIWSGHRRGTRAERYTLYAKPSTRP